jgi:putative inorganic carbon (hco3(-)) transporter
MRLILFIGFMGICTIIAFVRPFFGLIIFSWLSYMRPQNFVWATEGFRFSYIIGGALILGYLVRLREEGTFFKARENYIMLIFLIMLFITCIFSIWPTQSWPKFIEMTKIIIIAFITASIVNTRDKFKWMSLIIAGFFGFFAFKGAIQGALMGYRLRGPDFSMITDNNDFALAMNMAMPFFLYLGINETIKWRKYLLYYLFISGVATVIFTYSRGGFLGLVVIILALVLKSNRKLTGLVFLGVGLLIFVNFAPAEYKERIETIKHYEADESAMSRIHSWQAGWNMATSNPITGVGFRNYVMAYPTYHWSKPYVAHNSYIQLMAENGFISLFLFLLLLFFTIQKLRKIRKNIPRNEKTQWLHNYSHMLEVAFYGYITCSMFLSRADFDLFYQFVGMVVALEHVARTDKGVLESLRPKKQKKKVWQKRQSKK